MRVFNHENPDDPGTEYVRAVCGEAEVTIKRSLLPVGTQEAWDALAQMVDGIDVGPPPPPPESHPTLDLDWYEECSEQVNFNGLMEDVDNEIQYINALLPTIDGMTLADLKAAFKHSEKRDREILGAIKYIARVARFLVKCLVRWGLSGAR